MDTALSLHDVDFEIIRVIFLKKNGKGERHKLATIRPANKETFPSDPTRYNFHNVSEVSIHLMGSDVSTFYFEDKKLIPDAYRMELEETSAKFTELFYEFLLHKQDVTLEEFLTTISCLYRLYGIQQKCFPKD